MNNRFYLSAFLFLFLVSFSSIVTAQQGQDPQGEIEDVQVEIVKDREIVLPPAVRKFDKVPPQEDVQKRPDLQYNFTEPNITLSPLDLRLRPLRIKDEPLQKTYGNYIAAGFGNYTTPYAEVFINSKRNNNYTYGIHSKYLSSFKGPVDGKNSANGMFEVDLFGSYFGRAASLNGDIGFRRRNNNFYGYAEGIEIPKDSIEQHFNHVFAEVILQSTDTKSPWQYEFEVKADYLSDNLDANEVTAGINWLNRYEFNGGAGLVLNFSYDYINFTNLLVEGRNRHLLKVQPRLQLEIAGISLIAGFNTAYENDTIGDGDDLHFYPYAHATLSINEQWKIFAELDGDVQKNSYTEFSYENPFLGSHNLMFHTNKAFDLSGGIKGKLSQQVGVTGGFAVRNYKNMYFYVNNEVTLTEGSYIKPNWFSIVYDKGSTSVFSLFTELSLIANEDLYGNLKLQWDSYSTDEIKAAYHKPQWIIETNVFYQLVDKINLSMNFYGMGGMQAIDENGFDTTLDPAVDLNLKADYLLSDRVSIFVQFNNIFSQNYMLLNRYPVRGFQVMGGFTYNF